MTVKELIERLQQLPPDLIPVLNDEGNSIARVGDDGTLYIDRTGDY